ncbi:hypothetical protein H4S06_004260, partial [Coemansia sp. BCRC 34490]
MSDLFGSDISDSEETGRQNQLSTEKGGRSPYTPEPRGESPFGRDSQGANDRTAKRNAEKDASADLFG